MRKLNLFAYNQHRFVVPMLLLGVLHLLLYTVEYDRPCAMIFYYLLNISSFFRDIIDPLTLF